MRLVLLLGFAVWLPAASPPARFSETTIAADLKGGYQVVVADLNHDGKPDLIALASGLTELVWYENPGWQRHAIAGGMSHNIVLATGFANQARNSIGIVSVLHHNGDPREPWTVTGIDRLTTSHFSQSRSQWGSFSTSSTRSLPPKNMTSDTTFWATSRWWKRC